MWADSTFSHVLAGLCSFDPCLFEKQKPFKTDLLYVFPLSKKHQLVDAEWNQWDMALQNERDLNVH